MKDIIWLALLAIGFALAWPDYTHSPFPPAAKWVGMAMLVVAIIWQIIDKWRE